MNINGKLVFDGSANSEIQNLRLEKLQALPAWGSGDVGRLVLQGGVIYLGGASNTVGTSGWIPLATGGDASALLAEVDRIETSLGLTGEGAFDPALFTGNLAGQTSYVGLIQTLQGLAATNAAAITSEAGTRAAADTALGGRIDGVETAAATESDRVDTAIADEAEARTTADTALGGRIDGEVTRATTAEGALGTRIDGVVTAATTESTRVDTAISAETAARIAADTALGGRVDTEATARETGDTTNATAITAETTRATAAEGALDTRITTEVSDRTAAVDAVATGLATEITDRETAITGVTDLVTAEANRAIAQEAAIRGELASAVAGLTWEAPVNYMVLDHTTVTGAPVGSRVVNLTDFRIYTVTAGGFDAGEPLVDGAAFFFTVDDAGYVFTGDAVVQFNGASAIDAGAGLVKSGNTINIASTSGTIAVTDDSIDVSAGVLNSITANATAVAAETTRATTAETGLGDRIDDEAEARAAAVTAEAEARAAADTAEAGLRAAGDTALGARIDGVETAAATEATRVDTAIGAEATARIAGDTALGGRIDTEITDRQAAVTAEATARTAALAAEVTARDAAIAAEATARDAAIAVETTRATTAEAAIGTRIGKMYYLYTGDAPSASHTVTHTLGQRYCNVTVVDPQHNVVIPESIVFDSNDALTVTFNTAIACRVVVMGLAPAA